MVYWGGVLKEPRRNQRSHWHLDSLLRVRNLCQEQKLCRSSQAQVGCSGRRGSRGSVPALATIVGTLQSVWELPRSGRCCGGSGGKVLKTHHWGSPVRHPQNFAIALNQSHALFLDLPHKNCLEYFKKVKMSPVHIS